MSTLTKKQKRVFDYIKKYIQKKGYSPTFEEIGGYFKYSSLATVHEHLDTLVKKDLITKNRYSARGITLKDGLGTMVEIPFLGTITAGEPIEAIQKNETIAVPDSKLPKNGNVFALRVAGNSMIDENIRDGDVVLVRQQHAARNGERVVALIDNYEATLKKLYKERSHIRLQPANSAYEPIIITKDRDFRVQGIVIDVIQNTRALPARKEITAQAEPKKKTLPLNQIILGDAVVELKKLPDESCDVILIDPPYNIGKNFGNNLDKRELHEYVAWCKEWVGECIRTLKPSGTMFVYGFSEILAHLSVEISINKRWLIWHYTNKNVASLNFWQRSHEAIICAWKDEPVFNRDEIREPYTERFLSGAAGKVRKGTVGRFSKNGKETIYHAHDRGALPRDVIKIPALAGGAGMNERWFICKTCDKVCEPRELKHHLQHDTEKHPTQKPLELSRRLIKSAMPEKDGVALVPFVGTGSECVAAKELGLSYVGFEINPDYIKLAEKYLNSAKYTPTLWR